jgi:Cu+-exporting ATPase
MTVDPARAAGSSDYHGDTYFFCSVGCKTKFDADPERYLTKQATAPSSNASTWTCPMHPEILRDGPGSCPICGMALEPLMATLDEAPNIELIDMRRRLIVCTILTAPLLAIAMSSMHGSVAPWIQFALATPVVLWGGAPFFARGWMSLITRNLNMFTLIALGTGAAFAYSVVAVIAPGAFPPAFLEHGSLPLYFEPAAVITTLVLVGQVLELQARARTSGAIRALLSLTPKTARLVDEGGQERDVPIESLVHGSRVRVRPGERVPVDGVVIDGRASIDESTITGEPLPVEKNAGDRVTAGAISVTGSIVIEAQRVGAETLLAQIVRMVADAQRSRAPIQRLADIVSAWFVPMVIAVAILTFIAWAIVGPDPKLAHALLNAVAVLIIACPCALGLATPMSVMVATGRGALSGILVKNAEALETMAKVDTLLVDKTGTLTEGRPEVTAIETAEGFNEHELLTLVASLERASEHPLADALVRAARGRALDLMDDVTDVQTIAGAGVRGKVGARRVVVGNASIAGSALEARADRYRADGATVVFAGVDFKPAGLIAIADRVRETTAQALTELRARGIDVVMLTGDARATADAVARRLGILKVEAEMLPARKEEVVRRLQSEGHVVAMAGDGVNDAPALARADVGIAMGSGTDIAIESAAIALVKGDLRGIVRARILSESMLRNIRQNLFFAFIYNLLGVPVAAGLLYPFFGILLSPMFASAAMTLSSVTVITNALRLRRVRL